MRHVLGGLLALGFALAVFNVHADGMIELSAGMHRIQAEVAASDASRQRGLMFRREMPEYAGMLFVYPVRAIHCMWMKNTLLPLAVAFMDDDGVILNIEEMQAHSEKNHCARRDARYALEMNAGWFKRRGITPGMRIQGIAKAPLPV